MVFGFFKKLIQYYIDKLVHWLRIKRFNLQLDSEINIFHKGKEYTEDVNQFFKLDGNSRVDPKLIEDLKRRSGIKKEIYIIDK